MKTAIVVDANVLNRRLEEIIEQAGISIEPVAEAQALTARQAFRDFGIGSGHPAKLNCGDCFPSALVRVTKEPLLFKGQDFSHTGLASARP